MQSRTGRRRGKAQALASKATDRRKPHRFARKRTRFGARRRRRRRPRRRNGCANDRGQSARPRDLGGRAAPAKNRTEPAYAFSELKVSALPIKRGIAFRNFGAGDGSGHLARPLVGNRAGALVAAPCRWLGVCCGQLPQLWADDHSQYGPGYTWFCLAGKGRRADRPICDGGGTASAMGQDSWPVLRPWRWCLTARPSILNSEKTTNPSIPTMVGPGRGSKECEIIRLRASACSGRRTDGCHRYCVSYSAAPPAGQRPAPRPIRELRFSVTCSTACAPSTSTPPHDDKLIQTAMQGMLTSLDPHSSYMNSTGRPGHAHPDPAASSAASASRPRWKTT